MKMTGTGHSSREERQVGWFGGGYRRYEWLSRT